MHRNDEQINAIVVKLTGVYEVNSNETQIFQPSRFLQVSISLLLAELS